MTLAEARKLVFTSKPKFKKLYEAYHDKTWIEYAGKNFPHIDSSVAPLLQNDKLSHPESRSTETKDLGVELLDTFRKLLTPLVGESVAFIATQELNKSKFVSTADHHGLLWHPFFMNSALLRSYKSHESSVTISLTCEGVSFSNSSYPRGMMYHDKDLQEVRVPFVHRSNSPVYGYPALPKGEFTRKLPQLTENERVWNQKYVGDQFVALNDVLWHQVFGNNRGSLIYLPAESLVRKLLLDHHIGKKTFFDKILFNPTTRAAYIEHYNGIIGAHTGTQKGTHLFWYINKHHKRVQLWIEGKNLVASDKSITIPFTPKSIQKALESYQLLPSMALCYSILSFYYGLTLGGGFSQIQYLGEMKKAYQIVANSKKELPRTDIFTGEFVAIGLSNTKKSVPATLIDLLLYGNEDVGDIIDTQLQKISIGQSLDLMMPEFVHIITGNRPTIYHLPQAPSTLYVT